ncbi:PREDICTED: G-type lectin S-receptor-like serine/threonine-protein kinase SD2-5 [Tarenaya hassleriana]|uniref:G-type lectin S-receptor-like serine/threonine-protein kinase SD2-5 n=1 Tax=Tarenaya hassleriana TaxID=28532 RepID=UPI00053C7ADB|nr:PREDICTED: G-type lectin S-receptor-like serine/threonine-protein kinase SD2-5 [Tarenaya hassleriana]
MEKKIYTLSFLLCLLSKLQGICKSDIGLGYALTLATPAEFNAGFVGKAYIIQTEQTEPSFKAALAIEANEGRYSCSIEVFLGDVKVWSSGHYSKLYVFDKCVLELTKDGDLRLKGRKKHVGWRTGTAGQGVEKLQLLSTGNLVLVDEMGLIKWQSFNFPTDVMLQGQRLDVATQLTSFPSDSNMFYTFEVLRDKIALFVNSGQVKYSYWEYKPAKNQNVNFIRLGLEGLDLFDDNSHKIARIEPERTERTQLFRFLAVGNRTGNLGLYSYSSEKGKFETSFQALNDTCDLPLACKPYGICTFSKACSCIKIATKEENSMDSDCGEEISGEKRRSLCGHEMLGLDGVKTVLKNGTRVNNVSKEACKEMCQKDCKCAAAMYSEEGCFIYGIVMGVRQIESVPRLSFMVKVPKGGRLSDGKSGVRKWILGLVGGVDGFVILLVLIGVTYYFIRKRRKNSLPADSQSR